MKKAVLILSILIGLSSCHTTKLVPMQDNIKADNLGKTTAQIIETNGAPDRETTDGKDGKILVYESKSSVGTAVYRGYGVSSITSAERKEFMQFFIDKDTGKCYDVKTNVNKKTKQFSKGRTFGLCAGIAGAIAIVVIGATSSE